MNTGSHKLRISTLLVGFFALCSSFTGLAANMKTFGDIDVHYMAIGAAFLTPEVAKAYGIERSRYNGLVNISVLDNSQPSQPAKLVLISGTAKNLAGQNKDLTFDEVKEGQAIYYLAQVNYRHNETIQFSINITDGAKKHTLKFSQKFFAD
jgi:hypothetical protein